MCATKYRLLLLLESCFLPLSLSHSAIKMQTRLVSCVILLGRHSNGLETIIVINRRRGRINPWFENMKNYDPRRILAKVGKLVRTSLRLESLATFPHWYQCVIVQRFIKRVTQLRLWFRRGWKCNEKEQIWTELPLIVCFVERARITMDRNLLVCEGNCFSSQQLATWKRKENIRNGRNKLSFALSTLITFRENEKS